MKGLNVKISDEAHKFIANIKLDKNLKKLDDAVEMAIQTLIRVQKNDSIIIGDFKVNELSSKSKEETKHEQKKSS